ncbi:MAG: hypothetical protein ACLQM8_01975 [Limisphaerales bacterium]
MKQRFILFRRAGVYYSEDTTTRKQISLRTKDEAEALTLLHSKNEAHRQPILNLHIARTYLAATDPEIAQRTWQAPMDEMTRTKTGPTLIRYNRAMQDRAFDISREPIHLDSEPGTQGNAGLASNAPGDGCARAPSDKADRQPYRGKLAVNGKRGWGKRGQDLMAVCHDARKGRNTGSHWSKPVAPPLHSTSCKHADRRTRLFRLPPFRT